MIKTRETTFMRARTSSTIFYTIPLTCKVAVYLISAAGLVATHVYSPVCVAEREGILRRELYWSREVTLAPNTGGNGSPSLSQRSESGASPLETPHTVRVRIPSASPSWKEKGSIIGGTGKQEIERRKPKWAKDKNKIVCSCWVSVRLFSMALQYALRLQYNPVFSF